MSIDTTASVLDALAARLSDPGILDSSTLARALYSTDASIYRLVPSVVAVPRTRKELVELVRAALEVGLPITTRGAGTSCAGNAVGTGLIIDTSRHLNRIISIDEVSGTAEIEPGVIQSQLQAAVTPLGWRYGPDPSTANRCTVGGMIGNNACGPRALGYGRSADNIVELEVITGTGECLTLTQDAHGPTLDRLRQVVGESLGVIRTEFGTFTRQVSGYSMEHLLPEKGFDAAKFFAGTEGTLGVITRAVVKLVKDAPLKLTIALGYPTMADAADAMPLILPFSPTACEGMDRRLSDVVAERLGASAVPDLPDGDGWVFIELVGDDMDEMLTRAHGMVDVSGCTEGWVVTDPAQAARLWTIRTDAAGLASVALDEPAWAGWEDAAVPADRLGAYLRDFDALLERFGLHGLPYGHFGEGCVHCRIDVPLTRDDGTQVLHEFITEAGKLVASHGGSMSGEHGDGRARSELLPLMYSTGALNLFAAVKQIFDPNNLLNPGVLVDPEPLNHNVRPFLARNSPLTMSHPEFAKAVHSCTGVGKCRSDSTKVGSVMCPSYQASGDEKDSTRGRSRILQEMINGTLITGGWASPEVTEALELCLSCKGCRRDCPTGVDMAAFKSRVLFEKYRGRLRPTSHYAMGWLPRWGRLTTRLRIGVLMNFVLQTPGLQHIARWVAGVDQRRPMPRFRTGAAASHQHHELTGGTARRGRVAVWVDSFSDAFEGGQVVALLNLLVSLGFEPKVVSGDACCGLTWITTGQLDGARRQLRHALEVLAPIAEQQVPIIGLEPSCMAVWRSDAAELLPDEPRVAVVRDAITTLGELLDGLDDWIPPDLSGLTIVAQPHCHQTSVLGHAADKRVLERTGAKVIILGGCCGLAGNFGVERGHYETSVKVAEHDLLPAIHEAGQQAIILADGFSCRKQVKDLENRTALTLPELLIKYMG
ncbi:hypothetical protein HMPREF1531_00095 [Propionibacterium sp. oral taxon 192 str. F0372]|nr:hypothetical protein HMPREF1531_00095 [Propionibacterium sp. oral taxon 192 str. F0372]